MTKFILLIILGFSVAIADVSLVPNIALSWPLMLVPTILSFILNTRVKNGLPFVIGVGIILDIYSSHRFGIWLALFLSLYCLLFYLKTFFSESGLSYLLFATIFIYLMIELVNKFIFGITLIFFPILAAILIEIILAIVIWSFFLKFFLKPKQISLLERSI
ncbi:MAG: hypothetical protein UT11_C0042G0005 [Berkelbacteria bacterium GW2011_GWA2_38_9]|uniref:Rod shape-determining protein MreD n=1 Tax=Berkelbacteria bacterium GW2011_GWA2_38_9 TaxID=1618334 RepID=A0A0G0PFE2_9BACT|nr:MAG: hypothetical protein UT11_C0042G0005 [Berkelbacteria bacterium GW2011_GWA2_38_9]